MQETITTSKSPSPTTAAGTLRLLFHDCLPNGCDGSILISSTAFNKAERDADINLSLPGDPFDLIVRAKTALELACPNTVSCSDILAVAARDLVTMLGGPYYTVYLGRKDSRSSSASSIEGKLPKPTMGMSRLIDLFASSGFTVQEMVALKRCTYDRALKQACADYPKNPTLSVFNDIMTPNKFDNLYYQNLPKGLGLLESDHGLYNDPRTRPFVELYAKDQNKFFQDFAKAMQKLSVYGIKTGRRGEIRRRCDAVN
ncbi:hypothetical protein V6N12_016974 [Hibiscus sabdariffa]|uniref:peroxidase n=1 Tax=Hibiscus sabdariffa TaxID=183260 RepID=A0ABR2AUB4_9ROSI